MMKHSSRPLARSLNPPLSRYEIFHPPIHPAHSGPACLLVPLTVQDAMNALGFDGIAYGANFLKVRRPKDYKPLPGMRKSHAIHRLLLLLLPLGLRMVVRGLD